VLRLRKSHTRISGVEACSGIGEQKRGVEAM
jgi:hypothetical protein